MTEQSGRWADTGGKIILRHVCDIKKTQLTDIIALTSKDEVVYNKYTGLNNSKIR